MAQTGKLGTRDSRLGNIRLGISGDALNVLATSPLTLTVLAAANSYARSASSTLTLTSSASAPNLLHRAATSALALTQSATQPSRNVAATSTLSITQVADQSGPIAKSASSTISLTQAAVHHAPVSLAASSTLTLTQTAQQSGPLPRSATSTLELTTTVDTPIKRRSVTDTLSLTQTAVGDRVKRATSELTLSQTALNGIVQLSVTSSLTLTSTARNTNIVLLVPASQLELEQTVTTNIKMLSAESVISLSQSEAVLKPIYISASSPLITTTETFDPSTISFVTTEAGLSQSVGLTIFKSQPITHYLQLTSHANGYADLASGTPVDASNSITLVQQARLSIPLSVDNSLSLAQSAISYLANYQPANTLTLTNTAMASVLRAPMGVSNTLSLLHAVRFIHETQQAECFYTPFVGESTDPNAPTPPPSSLPAAAEVTGFRLRYPSTGAHSDELLLRAPNLGNIDRLSMDRIIRETRGGTLVVFADPIWPKVETLLLSFSVLKRDEAQSLLTFMRSHLGKEIRLIDWEDRAWTGVIVNPQDPIVEDRENSFTASFEFEGVRET